MTLYYKKLALKIVLQISMMCLIEVYQLVVAPVLASSLQEGTMPGKVSFKCVTVSGPGLLQTSVGWHDLLSVREQMGETGQ